RTRATASVYRRLNMPPCLRRELVDVLTVSPSRRRLRWRWLDIHDPTQDLSPFLERCTLLVVTIAVVDGGHRAVRHASMVEDMRDVKAIDARFAHVRRRGPSQVVRAAVERHAAVAQGRCGLLCTGSHTGVTVVREHVSVVGVLRPCSSVQHYENHRGERHPVWFMVLRDLSRNQPPACV